MKITLNCLGAALLIAAFAFGAAAQPKSADDIVTVSTAKKDGISLSVTVAKASEAGAALALKCVVENQTKNKVYYLTSTGFDFFLKFDVVDSREKTVPKTRFGQRILPQEGGSYVTAEIKPGKSRTIVF